MDDILDQMIVPKPGGAKVADTASDTGSGRTTPRGLFRSEIRLS